MRENSSTSSFKKLAALGLFVACAILFSYFIGGRFEDLASKNKINEWNAARFREFYALPKDSIDMLFVGSSHSYCTFDPEEIEKRLGLKSFQLGMPQQHPDSTYYMIEEALNYQSPKEIVFEVYWDMLDDDFEPKQIDSLFQVLNNDSLKKEFIFKGFPLNQKIKYFIKPIRFQKDFIAYKNSALLKSLNDDYGINTSADQPIGKEEYKSGGFMYCDYVMTEKEYASIINSHEKDMKDWKISASQLNYILKIISISKEHNIRLTFVTAPISNIAMSKIKNYGAIHDAIAKISNEHKISYLDFNYVNSNGILFTDSDFRDKSHLNYSGAVKACEYFAEWLKIS